MLTYVWQGSVHAVSQNPLEYMISLLLYASKMRKGLRPCCRDISVRVSSSLLPLGLVAGLQKCWFRGGFHTAIMADGVECQGAIGDCICTRACPAGPEMHMCVSLPRLSCCIHFEIALGNTTGPRDPFVQCSADGGLNENWLFVLFWNHAEKMVELSYVYGLGKSMTSWGQLDHLRG